MASPPFPVLPDPATLAPRVVTLCAEAARELEFATFLVGVQATRLGRDVPEAVFLAWKAALRRAAGGVLAAEWARLGRRPEFVRPEVLFVFDADRGQVEPKLRPVHLYGRYRKLTRDVTQTRAHWKHEPCRGKGCPECGGTGRSHPVSVEDLLGEVPARAFQASEWRLHGLGREDVDVRCLGTGRPMVLELKEPRRRSADLAALTAEVLASAAGRVELVGQLRLVGEDVVPRLKGSTARKTYRARVQAAGPLDPAALAALPASLSGRQLEQRTPERVARRRADLIRPRTVQACELLAADGLWFDLRLETDSGTYVKELISGDEGRTRPSVSELLGVPCTCAELDVLDIGVTDEEMLAPALTGDPSRVESDPYDAG